MKDKWSDFYNAHGRFYLQPHSALSAFINLCKKKGITKVLDLGCGTGRHIVKLAEEGFNVSGIDFSPSAASLAEKWLHQKNLEADIIVGNFDDKIKDFPDNSFGGVVAINSLEYGGPDEFNNNLNQIYKLLKSKGLFLLVYRSKESQMKHPEVETRFLSEEELKQILHEKFNIVSFSQDKDKHYVVIAERK